MMGDQWYFVSSKRNPRWLFYAYNRTKRQVLCHVFRRRTKATLRRLLSLLKEFSIHYVMTDTWHVYQAVLDPKKHIIENNVDSTH